MSAHRIEKLALYGIIPIPPSGIRASFSYHHQGIMSSFQMTRVLLRQPTCEVIPHICLVVDLPHSSSFHILLQGLALFGWSQPWSSSFPRTMDE